MSRIDVEAICAVLQEAAREEILPRFGRLDATEIRQKTSAIDLVTEADEAAERFIRDRLQGLLPDALFVGEESVAADPSLLDAMNSAPVAVTVDPIDGTANFAAGLPLFAVMVAVVVGGETVAGIIYDPMGDDWVLAEKGSGAFRRRADGSTVVLKVADPVPLDEIVGTVSLAYLPAEHKPNVLQNLARIRVPANYRVAGHDYRLLAGGHTHFCCFNKLMPWDHLPGTLIVQEAGGYLARFDGSPYLPHHRAGGLLGAVDRPTWDLLRRDVLTF